MLSFNPIMVDNYAASFNCTPMGWVSDYETQNFDKFNGSLPLLCRKNRFVVAEKREMCVTVFTETAASAAIGVPCGGPKMSPLHHS